MAFSVDCESQMAARFIIISAQIFNCHPWFIVVNNCCGKPTFEKQSNIHTFTTHNFLRAFLCSDLAFYKTKPLMPPLLPHTCSKN